MQGKISYINHDKQYAVVEYMDGNKKKTAKADIGPASQKELKEKNQVRKTHQFSVGDVVEFKHTLSTRGDRMIATNLKFQYNAGLDVLINKASLLNEFHGYIKEADGKLFIKEIETYLFIPLKVSPWQILPSQGDREVAVSFFLENIEKKKPHARLVSEKFIPAYYSAKRALDKKEVTEGKVTRVSANGIYIDLFEGSIKAKIPLDKKYGNEELGNSIESGAQIPVLITHIGTEKIIVKPVL